MPDSQSEQALAVLQQHEGEPVTLTMLAEELGWADPNRASMLVSTSLNRRSAKSPWRYVRRVRRGVYTYDETWSPDPDPRWVEVARDEFGGIVLRSPDGRLWVPHPVST